MPLSRESLERQLARAEADRSQRTGQLDEQGVPESGRRRDPIWRSCDAVYRQLQTRLAAVRAKDELSASMAESSGSGDSEGSEED